MKKSRIFAHATLTLGLCLGLVAGHPRKAAADPIAAVTYILTVTGAKGAFSSRQVITLHPDHSVFVVDSGQETASGSFSSEQGVWKIAKGEIAAHLFDFDYKPVSDFARADYALEPIAGGFVKGTITLQVFPLKGDPLGRGTVYGTYAVTGYAVPN